MNVFTHICGNSRSTSPASTSSFLTKESQFFWKQIAMGNGCGFKTSPGCQLERQLRMSFWPLLVELKARNYFCPARPVESKNSLSQMREENCIAATQERNEMQSPNYRCVHCDTILDGAVQVCPHCHARLRWETKKDGCPNCMSKRNPDCQKCGGKGWVTILMPFFGPTWFRNAAHRE